jgi:hypothetical protein
MLAWIIAEQANYNMSLTLPETEVIQSLMCQTPFSKGYLGWVPQCPKVPHLAHTVETLFSQARHRKEPISL